MTDFLTRHTYCRRFVVVFIFIPIAYPSYFIVAIWEGLKAFWREFESEWKDTFRQINKAISKSWMNTRDQVAWYLKEHRKMYGNDIARSLVKKNIQCAIPPNPKRKQTGGRA